MADVMMLVISMMVVLTMMFNCDDNHMMMLIIVPGWCLDWWLLRLRSCLAFLTTSWSYFGGCFNIQTPTLIRSWLGGCCGDKLRGLGCPFMKTILSSSKQWKQVSACDVLWRQLRSPDWYRSVWSCPKCPINNSRAIFYICYPPSHATPSHAKPLCIKKARDASLSLCAGLRQDKIQLL